MEPLRAVARRQRETAGGSL